MLKGSWFLSFYFFFFCDIRENRETMALIYIIDSFVRSYSNLKDACPIIFNEHFSVLLFIYIPVVDVCFVNRRKKQGVNDALIKI